MTQSPEPPPPQWSADGRWWWNGTQWVPAPNQPQYPPRPPEAWPGPATGGPAGAYAYPQGQTAAKPQAWYANPWLMIPLVIFVLIAVAAAVGDSLPAVGESGPDEEKAFIAAVQDGQQAAEETDNEIQLVQAQQSRDEAICAVLPASKQITDWVGEVEDVETTTGGDSGVLTIRIADDIDLGTHNNGFSDTLGGDDTLIDKNSPLYDDLAELGEGDKVTFTGEFIPDDEACVREMSLTDQGSVATPTFLMRFTAVTRN